MAHGRGQDHGVARRADERVGEGRRVQNVEDLPGRFLVRGLGAGRPDRREEDAREQEHSEEEVFHVA